MRTQLDNLASQTALIPASEPHALNTSNDSSTPSPETVPAWKTSSTYKTFSKALRRDSAHHALSPQGKELIRPLVYPDASHDTKVQTQYFGVGDVRANDIFMIRREPVVPGKTNFVLYIPEKHTDSLREFKTTQEVHQYLKELAQSPVALEAFLKHFDSDPNSDTVKKVKQLMLAWASSPDDSVPEGTLGEAGNILGNVFEQLHRFSQEPKTPIDVNGLSDLKRIGVSHLGFAIYSGVRPDGEVVTYKYDASGSLTGLGSKGNLYYLKDALTSNKPIVALQSENSLGGRISGAFDLLVNGFGDFLKNPFFWTSEFLELLGVSRETAASVEVTLDNPVTALLKFLNKHNDIGKQLGKSKAEMDDLLATAGDYIQGLVPKYGWGRAIGEVAGDAIKNRQPTDRTVKELEDLFQDRL
ncbi:MULTISPECIES: DUF6543 domain-containing protein [unclassified Pseudomonas]|uniref:dermonecrotic toxin domain-containing protein n=1 Tax=unclassified Pseudomonas TaxID=196821 RepID=UPI001F55CCF2|nr:MULTISPECIES: DUF6543 domain-containing protein [unclassified Pseudomonas]